MPTFKGLADFGDLPKKVDVPQESQDAKKSAIANMKGWLQKRHMFLIKKIRKIGIFNNGLILNFEKILK